jgi:hypothetical protein
MVVAVVRIGPAAAWRGHETFRDQVADLPLRDGGQPDQVANIHGSAFRQIICQKDEAQSSSFDILFVERMTQRRFGPRSAKKQWLYWLRAFSGKVATGFP